jgi:UDP-3-O-[3-hydroxymyristoyl] N-acetylglucosamine deacetylase/3-hydroxyacyl-[acyl-carrier-protein] dehydratase
MLQAMRHERTLARTSAVRGVGFFHGADVAMRFHPAEAGAGITFSRIDLPGAPVLRAHIDNVIPSQRRTTIREGQASVEMIEHVMAAFAGLRIDNCFVEIDAGECPGCDGSSRAYVEAFEKAGIVEQHRKRPVIVLEEPIGIREGDATLAAHPGGNGRLTLSYHLDYGRDTPIRPQSVCLEINPESFRVELADSRTFVLETEANALRAHGIGLRTTPADLLIFGQHGIIDNALRYPDECARHKTLDLLGDLALIGCDLDAFVVAHRSGHHTNATLARKLLEVTRPASAARAGQLPVSKDGLIDIEGIMNLLPHRYPFLLVDRVLELEPGRRVVAIKNVSVNEPFFQGHWPKLPIMPGVLIVEAMAQAAGVLIAASVDQSDRAVVIASIDGVKLRRPVVPGDQLRLEGIGERIKSRSAYVTCRGLVGDSVAAEAKLRFVAIDTERGAQSSSRPAADHRLATLVQ